LLEGVSDSTYSNIRGTIFANFDIDLLAEKYHNSISKVMLEVVESIA